MIDMTMVDMAAAGHVPGNAAGMPRAGGAALHQRLMADALAADMGRAMGVGVNVEYAPGVGALGARRVEEARVAADVAIDAREFTGPEG